jgi:hypothetical protein
MADGAMTGDVGPWVLGGIIALLGLGLASRAEDDVLYGTGLGLFVFCVLFIFYLIHRYVGRSPGHGVLRPARPRAHLRRARG